jgi:hypothetical protein
MTKKDTLQPLRAQYEIARHHAWAGTVLLSVLLAIRIFFEMAENRIIPDNIFILFGLIIASYTLGALFFTYRYREALLQKEQENYQKAIDETHLISGKTENDRRKQRYKIEKKKVKTKIKKEKKVSKL